MFVNVYIHNKYTKHTYIYVNNIFLFWIRLIMINRLTPLLQNTDKLRKLTNLQSMWNAIDLIAPDTGSWSSQWSHLERWWFPSPWVPDTPRPVTSQGTEQGWWWWSLLHRVPTNKKRLIVKCCSFIHVNLCIPSAHSLQDWRNKRLHVQSSSTQYQGVAILLLRYSL